MTGSSDVKGVKGTLRESKGVNIYNLKKHYKQLFNPLESRIALFDKLFFQVGRHTSRLYQFNSLNNCY